MKTKMKIMRASVLATVLIVVMTVTLPGYAAAGSSGGGPGGTTVHYTGLRNTRYCEFDLVNPPAGGVALDTVYNTTHLDTCPTALWNAENPTQLAQQFHVAKVGLNGPRWWTLDQVVVHNVGASPSFGGIKAADWGSVTISPSNPLPSPPYTDTVVNRDTQWVFSAGQPVYTLIAPDGKTYYMQAYTTQVDKSLTINSLPTLGSKLQLPKGWQYKTRVLNRDLSLFTVNGEAHVVGDNLSNAYMLLTTPSK